MLPKYSFGVFNTGHSFRVEREISKKNHPESGGVTRILLLRNIYVMMLSVYTTMSWFDTGK